MTDSELKAAYIKAIGRPMSDNHVEEAHAFVAAIFDSLTPVTFTDGKSFAEEEWMLADPKPLYGRP